MEALYVPIDAGAAGGGAVPVCTGIEYGVEACSSSTRLGTASFCLPRCPVDPSIINHQTPSRFPSLTKSLGPDGICSNATLLAKVSAGAAHTPHFDRRAGVANEREKLGRKGE